MAECDQCDPNLVKELELYHKHYTDLFVYQARQRIDSIRFYLIAVAVAANAITGSAGTNFSKTVIALVAGFVTLIFLRLDYRNSQIVEVNEKPLKYLQTITRKRMNVSEEWVSFKSVDAGKGKLASYGTLIPVLYGVITVSWFAASIFFFRKWCEAEQIPSIWSGIYGATLVILSLSAVFLGKPIQPPEVTLLTEPSGADTQ